jgi:membrane carboxypeptidase/penicillin-binding protein
MIKKSGIAISLILIGVFIYSAGVISQAETYTEEVILNDHQLGVWRIYGGKEYPLTLKIGDLTQKQVDWMLAIQDPGFYEHNGIDLSTPGAGLTTISQSIVKKLYFKAFKPGIRKLKQSLIARFVVNNQLTKNQQLEIFINSVYMGSLEGKKIYGLAQSSQIYFGKEVSQLSEKEYLSLIAMLIGPDRFNVLEAPEKNRERVSRIKAVLSGAYKPSELTDVYYNRI